MELRRMPTLVCGKRGFTVIELLVVMAIIAVLVATLLPSLKHAREKGRIVLCASHLRQWGLIYSGYQADYKEFYGGVTTSTEMRFLFTGANQDYAPDNVAPWGPSSWYEQTPFNRSTFELGKRGLFGKISSGKTITHCPSRLTSTPALETYGSGLDSPNALTYTDYACFAGFGNDLGTTFDPISGGYLRDKTPDTSSCWGHDYGRFPSVSSGPPLFTTKARYPTTRGPQKRSSKTILAMDRHFAPSATMGTCRYYGYQDFGDFSNHMNGRSANAASAEGTTPEWPSGVKPVALAAGANCLMIDFSVVWTAYDINPALNTHYGQDFYYNYSVGKNLASY